MTDRYTASGNHPENKYYPNSAILVNKLDIKDDELLAEFENMALVNAVEHFYSQVESISKLDSLLLKDIHKYFLGKLYSWAGEYRTVAIKKGDSTFAMPQYIPKLMENFNRQLAHEKYLKSFSLEKLAYFKCELIAIHPFREGNGRTIRLFCDLLAIKQGYGRIEYPETTAFQEAYIKASIAAVMSAEYMPMYELLRKLKA